MERSPFSNLSRRTLLKALAALPFAFLFTSRSHALEYTPEILDDDDLTPEQTEGPYFTPNSPEKKSLLEDGIKGTKLILSGQVLGADGKPVKHALVDIWHCNAQGVYDNVGYKLRGHQYTDDKGQYRFETIVPGVYIGRTRHIHVKVQAPHGRILTTQLYFPEDADLNRRDGIYSPKLLLKTAEKEKVKTGSFDFVVRTA